MIHISGEIRPKMSKYGFLFFWGGGVFFFFFFGFLNGGIWGEFYFSFLFLFIAMNWINLEIGNKYLNRLLKSYYDFP